MTTKQKTKYRSTKEWKEKRKQLLEDLDSTCQLCGKRYTGKSKRLLQVHHINTDSYGNEQDGDITLLCSSCHQYLERLYKVVRGKNSKPNKWYPIFNKLLSEFFDG